MYIFETIFHNNNLLKLNILESLKNYLNNLETNNINRINNFI